MFRNWHFSLKYCICSCLIFLVVIGLGWESASKGFTSPLLSVSGGESLPLVIIDAGHGGEDCGAIGVNGVYEKDINLAISFALGDWLSSVGYPVLFTRSEDKLLYTEEQNIKGQRKAYDLRNRLEIAQKHPGSIFVSIHMNSFSDGQYSGLQVWHNGGELSKSVAEGIQSTVRELLQKGNTRTVKTADSSMYLLHRNEGTAILVECGFLSSERECVKLCEQEYQKELSFAIFCGIMNANSLLTHK